MSDGKLLHGQLFETSKNIIRRYTQQMMDKAAADALLGNARTEIIPNTQDSSEVKVWDDVTTDIIANITDIFGSSVSLQGKLPDVLTGITVTYNENKGEGQYSENANGTSGGSASSSLTFNLNGNAQSSFALIADVALTISSPFKPNVAATNYLFYMSGDPTQAAVIARLAQAPFSITVLPWPSFTPQRHNLTITGQQVDINVTVKVDQSAGGSTGNSFFVRSTGRGHSLTTGVSIRTIEIPPTIHGAITILDTDRIGNATAEASVEIIAGLNFPGYQETVSRNTHNIAARVRPTTLAATSPSAIPTTGKYLLDWIVQKDEFDLNKVQATVIDFATI